MATVKAFANPYLAGSLLAVLSVLSATTGLAADSSGQATYSSPQAAIDALVTAAKSGDRKQILKVLGPEGREVASSGDAVADAAGRERFLAAYDAAHELKQGDNRATLVIGKEEFPFPIPLVSSGGAWRFDTAAGAEEILDRRIGENELAAIRVLRSFVDAEREYAEADRDGKGVQYARRILSSDGQRDGLYWPSEDGDPESPFGPLIAFARGEGYSDQTSRPMPYHGYLFRVLVAQGKNAKGGARDYVVNGRMIGGFALAAFPAEYGNSGVMTFIVNHDGVVYQADLGPDTSRIAAFMMKFDPDSRWKMVE